MGFAAIALTLCVVTIIIIACENVEAIPPFYARYESLLSEICVRAQKWWCLEHARPLTSSSTFLMIVVSISKIVHMASGIVLALINPTGASSSFIAIVFVSIVLLRVSVTPFRFCQRGDIGITVYGIVVCCWCLMGLPFRYLTPMFFADPMAAVVGRSVKPEVRWYKNKTVAGSLTCFFAAYLSLLLGPITSHLYRLLVAGVMCGAEAVGGALDNMLVAVLCLAVAAVWG
eukprot:GHVN01013077.1.p1 GENE.GHVN01013077.1~~GHVN01013077.1.p1  ORF type:complete len:230 (-),score=33.42 GHVN01013077.1:322-1011(-)